MNFADKTFCKRNKKRIKTRWDYKRNCQKKIEDKMDEAKDWIYFMQQENPGEYRKSTL